MVTKGEEYVDQGEERYREKVVRSLSRKASQLGFQLVPMPETA